MFPRKKRNRTGTISVVVVDKSRGIVRICQPLSKSATADYLKSYFHEDVSLDQTYRYTDKLYNKQRELVQQISVEHTRRILSGSVGLMFYDVTSLYFD